jgi:hypothetical protein
MPFYFFQWTPQIEEHLAQHGVTPEEFEEVVMNPARKGFSDSSGDQAVMGDTNSGRRLFCAYRMIDDVTVEPVTAYDI